MDIPKKRKLFEPLDNLSKQCYKVIKSVRTTESGLPKYVKKCEWCYSLIYFYSTGERNQIKDITDGDVYDRLDINRKFCCRDCFEEHRDFMSLCALNRKKAREKIYKDKRYKEMKEAKILAGLMNEDGELLFPHKSLQLN